METTPFNISKNPLDTPTGIPEIPVDTPTDPFSAASTAIIGHEPSRYHQIMLVGDEHDFTPHGLTPKELEKFGPLRAADGGPPANYQLVKGPTIIAMSALGHMGYRVATSTRKKGSNDVIWVLEKILKHPFNTLENIW